MNRNTSFDTRWRNVAFLVQQLHCMAAWSDFCGKSNSHMLLSGKYERQNSEVKNSLKHLLVNNHPLCTQWQQVPWSSRGGKTGATPGLSSLSPTRSLAWSDQIVEKHDIPRRYIEQGSTLILLQTESAARWSNIIWPYTLRWLPPRSWRFYTTSY